MCGPHGTVLETMRKSRKPAPKSAVQQRLQKLLLRLRIALGIVLLAVPVPASVLAEYNLRNYEHEVFAGEIIAAVVDHGRLRVGRHPRPERPLAQPQVPAVPRFDEATLPASAWPPPLRLPPPSKIRLRWLN